MRFRVRASTFGATRRGTPASGLTIKCTASATLSGPMVSNTRVISRRISAMARVASSGRTAESTRVAGSAGNRAELATT